MERTWKPTTAGILSIISGAFGIVFGVLLSFAALYAIAMENPEWGLAVFFSAVPFALGIFAIVGGCFALKRRIWGLALAGSIAAFFVFLPLGVIAVIIVAISKNEF